MVMFSTLATSFVSCSNRKSSYPTINYNIQIHLYSFLKYYPKVKSLLVDKQEGENIRRYSQNNINDEFLNQNFKANVDICVIAEKPSPQQHFEGTKDGNECSHNQCWYDIEAQPWLEWPDTIPTLY